MTRLGRDVWGAAISHHESQVIRYLQQGQLFDAARFDSPDAIGRAYAAGLDALEHSIGHESDFQEQGGRLIEFINSWINDIDDAYSDYLSVSRNVGGFDHDDLIRAIDIAINGISVASVLMELIETTATGLLSGDIDKIANYRSEVVDFKVKVEDHIALNIVGRRG